MKCSPIHKKFENIYDDSAFDDECNIFVNNVNKVSIVNFVSEKSILSSFFIYAIVQISVNILIYRYNFFINLNI